jgi:hypothetical protein
MTIGKLIQDAPDGTNCVTVVSSVPSVQPTAILSQFIEDGNGNWRATGEPIILPTSQLPELIEQLEGVIAGMGAVATNDVGTSPQT